MKTKKQLQLTRYFIPILIGTVLTISFVIIGKNSQAQNTGARIADAGVAKSDNPPAPGFGEANQQSPLTFVTEMPAGYRDWRLISVAHEEGNLHSFAAVLGNDVAIKAYREGKLPFPDGTIIASLHYHHVSSEENNKVFGRDQSFVPGDPSNIQFMIKDSKKYASTGGWGFGHFQDGRPLTDKAKLKGCFDCHSQIKSRDLVFTRYAP
jgi:hypothetical protein